MKLRTYTQGIAITSALVALPSHADRIVYSHSLDTSRSSRPPPAPPPPTPDYAAIERERIRIVEEGAREQRRQQLTSIIQTSLKSRSALLSYFQEQKAAYIKAKAERAQYKWDEDIASLTRASEFLKASMRPLIHEAMPLLIADTQAFLHGEFEQLEQLATALRDQAEELSPELRDQKTRIEYRLGTVKALLRLKNVSDLELPRDSSHIAAAAQEPSLDPAAQRALILIQSLRDNTDNLTLASRLLDQAESELTSIRNKYVALAAKNTAATKNAIYQMRLSEFRIDSWAQYIRAHIKSLVDLGGSNIEIPHERFSDSLLEEIKADPSLEPLL